MAIFPSRTRPIAGNRFSTPAVGTNRQQGAVAPANAHTRSLLSQASRNGRLNNIGSVQALLTAHAGTVRGGGGNRGRK
jgi:hypothetical protein